MNNSTVSTYPSLAKFTDFVQLKDYRQPTKDEYVRYVRKLGEHYQCDPATLSEDQLRAYFLFLRQEKKFGGSAMKLARCSLRSFFRDCLHVPDWTVFEAVRIAPPQTLPLVLSREEVATLLRAVQHPRYRAVLGLIYHTGLRVGEAVRIERRDFRDTATEHPRLHVRCGKGGKDRFVPTGPSDGAGPARVVENAPASEFPLSRAQLRLARALPARRRRPARDHAPLGLGGAEHVSAGAGHGGPAGRSHGAYVAPLLRDAPAGGGREFAVDQPISRARVAGDDVDLHAPDAAQRGAHAGGTGGVASGGGVRPRRCCGTF
ncbi:MAG: phage integrase N-terminal SAM-like domain-containing protein [Verrucomicrobiota bacterium]